uniref:transposase n=1 Tax=Candidatus Enterovibrio escicola TaxID=1927127 RepID=UPI00123802F2
MHARYPSSALLLPHSPTWIAFVDSAKLQVCNNLRILRHQVFKGTAKRGKGTLGWFYGFKLYFIINEHGGIISVKVTTAIMVLISSTDLYLRHWCFFNCTG